MQAGRTASGWARTLGMEGPRVSAGRLCSVRDPEAAQRFSTDQHRAPPSAGSLTLLPEATHLGHSPTSPLRSSRASAAAGVGRDRSQLTLRPRKVIAMSPAPQVSSRSVPRKGPGSPRQGLSCPPGPQHLSSSDGQGGQDSQHDAPTPVRLPAVSIPSLLGGRISTDRLAFR